MSIENKGRNWFVTMQIGNFENAGWKKEDYLNPQWLAEKICQTWEDSKTGRKCGVTVCRSAEGLYHAHVGAYSPNSTTLKNVAKIFFNSHVELQRGNKEQLTKYLKKEGSFEEKGEKVLCEYGLSNIQTVQGQRSDLDEIRELILAGLMPSEIFELDIKYLRYERIVKKDFWAKCYRETGVMRDVKVFWHTGEAGTGKTYTYKRLTDEHGADNVYLVSDYESGGFDAYQAEPILFLDEFKGDIPYRSLLLILDKYRTQTHCRYANCYNLWTEVHIASIYPPEEAHQLMVPLSSQNRDSLQQLMRRITEVIYHYKENEEYKSFSMPASDYINYADLKKRAMSNQKAEFIQLGINDITPFQTGSGAD